MPVIPLRLAVDVLAGHKVTLYLYRFLIGGLRWLLHLRLIHHENGYTMVHAGIRPQGSIKKVIKLAREVEAVLQSADCQELFCNMYGDEPAIWSEELAGVERLRAITNYLTGMCYCTKDGGLDLESKGASSDPDIEKVSTWFSHPKRKVKDDKILLRHWASLEDMTDSPLDIVYIAAIDGSSIGLILDAPVTLDLTIWLVCPKVGPRGVA